MMAAAGALAMAAGLFLLLFGVALFVVGLMPGATYKWWKQYAWSALALTGAFYLLRYALQGLPGLAGSC